MSPYAIVICAFAVLPITSTEISAETCSDATALLQVSASVKSPSSSDASAERSQDNGVCNVTLTDGRDCSPFSKAEEGQLLKDFSWQERLCKMRIPPENKPNPDACLWQGCIANKNLTQGALWYMKPRLKLEEVPYCFKEHCGNTEFNLLSTTVDDARAYCDKKFGKKWRELKVGPSGIGNAGEQPGSGLWECAHDNYHCDWSYCKVHFCDNAKAQAWVKAHPM